MLPHHPTTHRSDVTLQLARGLELVRRHRWAHAVVALTSALELDPDEPKALEHRARCFLMLGRMNEALSDAERLVEVDKQRNAAYVEKIRQQQAAQVAVIASSAADRLSPTSAAEQHQLLDSATAQDTASAALIGSPVGHRGDRGGDDQQQQRHRRRRTGSSGGTEKLETVSPVQLVANSPKTREMLRAGGRMAQAARVAIALAKAKSPISATELRRPYEETDSDADDDDGEGGRRLTGNRLREYVTSPEVTKERLVGTTGSSLQRGKGALLRQSILATARSDITGAANGGEDEDDDEGGFGEMQQQQQPRALATRSSPKHLQQQQQQVKRPTSAVVSSPRRNNKQHQHHQFSSPTTRGGRSSSPASPAFSPHRGGGVVPMKYYVGVLLRAQVLFAMGCFEEACRQFHDGQRARPDVDEFSTGVSECQHVLMGAVHPWRRRHAPASSAALKDIRSSSSSQSGSRPISPDVLSAAVAGGGGGGSRPSSARMSRPRSRGAKRMSEERDHGQKQQQQQQKQDDGRPTTAGSSDSSKSKKPWRPPRPDLSYDDKETKLCMPEMAEDYFFLRKLRQHPRMFDTGVGAGVARSHDNPVIRQITRQLQSARKLTTAMTGTRGAFNIKGGVGDASADLTQKRFGGVSGSQAASSSKLGADKVPGLFGETPFAGPAQLTAFCAAAAAEAAEEEMLRKQSAAIVAHAEAQAEKAAKSQRGTMAHTPGTAEAKKTGSVGGGGGDVKQQQQQQHDENSSKRGGASSPSAASGAGAAGSPPSLLGGAGGGGLGMFGNMPDDDEGKKQRHRDFHIRPPDTRSWGVQSARGRRRMKEGVDTTLQYLSTQQRFWAHRDERTNVPSLDEPDLPPRFRPGSASTARGSSSSSARFAPPKLVPLSAQNLQQQAGGGGGGGRRRSSVLRHALRPVVTGDSSFDSNNKSRRQSTAPPATGGNDRRRSTVHMLQQYIESRRSSNDPSVIVSSDDGDDNPFRKWDEMDEASRQFGRVKDIEPDIEENSSEAESRFVNDMQSVFKLMAEQHDANLGDEDSGFSTRKYARQTNDFYQQQQQKQQRGRSPYGIGGGRGGTPEDRSPKITSGDYNFVRSYGDEVNSCVLAVPSSDAQSGSPAPVFASENLRSVHHGIQMALSRGAAEVVADDVNLAHAAAGAGASTEQHQAARQKREQQQQQRRDGGGGGSPAGMDDLARIQRALFDGGEDPYLITGGGDGNGRRSPSQQRAVTLRWGEYDGLHFGESDSEEEQQKKQQHDADSSAEGGKGKKSRRAGRSESPDDATAKRYRARQHARHQRARALLAQNIRKELNVELPYEAVFRVPMRRRDSGLAPAPPPTSASKHHHHHHHHHQKQQQQSQSPPWHRMGRQYASVSIRGSPPGKSWAIKQSAIGADLVEGSRSEEVAKALARKKQQEEEAAGEGQEMETVYDEHGNEIRRPKKKKRKRSRSRSPSHEGGGEDGERADRGEEDDDDRHDGGGGSGDDDGFSSTASSAEPLTLEEVRSMYSRSTKQKMRRDAEAMIGGSRGGKLRRQRSGIGFNLGGGHTSAAPSDEDSETDSDTDSDEDYDDADDDGGGAGDDEAAGIAEAISAAKALLDERGKKNTLSWDVGTDQQQMQIGPDGKAVPTLLLSSAGGGAGGSGSPTKSGGESAAMRKLNATLRNISRLCALGDVPQAIAIAAALVRELEAADSAAGSPQSPSTSPRSSKHHHHATTTGGGRRQHQHQQSLNDDSGPSPFIVLAARLRCTLGGLYLEIGEGSAAVAELSRAVLLAKKVHRNDVYEHAVTLLGECYQTSGEDVAESFEASQPRKRARAASVVRT